MNRAFSFGGGRQSTAALVLAARGELQVDCFVFANVGNDSENPETLDYIERYSKPYATMHGVELVEVQREFRDGRDPSLYRYLTDGPIRTVPIPVRMANGAPGNRTCTSDWKIRVIAKYLRQRWGPTWGELALGISWDEVARIHAEGADQGDYRRVYPLVERRLTASDCLTIIAAAGLPEPPKSACWFCPFRPVAAWSAQRLRQPDLFAAAVGLERMLNERRGSLGKDAVYLSSRCKPLDVAVPEGAEQTGLFDSEEDACTSGYCWT